MADAGQVNPLSSFPARIWSRYGLLVVVVACVSVLAASLFAAPAFAAPSALSPQPAAASFSDQDIHGGFHQNLSVVFTNGGGSDVTVSDVTIAGADSSQFNVANQDCGGATVSGGSSCQVTVEFFPTTRGAKSATLSLVDDSGTVDVPLTGSGITGTLTATPNPLDFTPQPWFYGGQQQGININVSPDAGVQTSSANITGPDAGLFYIAWGQNCANQTYGAGSGCGVGIGFNPSGPGTFHAQLEVASDSASSPLVIPITATALFGPRTLARPTQVAFGDVQIGQERTLPATLTNDGDAPLQVQQLLFITGRPDVFFVTSDACSAKTLDPGKSCQMLVHFKPSAAGEKEASLFFITGNSNQPVTPVGVNGTGVAPPDGAVSLEGRPIAGGKLTCSPARFPHGTAFRYKWLRNGREVVGATTTRLLLGDNDIGGRFACRVAATNAIATHMVPSPESDQVAPRQLDTQRHAFVDRWACRTINAPRVLSVDRYRVTASYGHPVTPEAPYTLRSKRNLIVSVDGRRIGKGRHVKVGPAALSAIADGAHTLTVTAARATTATQLLLAPCQLALRVRAGHNRPAAIALSARTGMRSLSIKLPRGLRVARTRTPTLGTLRLARAGLSDINLRLTKTRTSYNGVTIALTPHRLRVRGLPSNVGVLRLQLRRGVLTGRGGNVHASSVLMGRKASVSASAHSR